MNGFRVTGSPERPRALNAVSLQNAVLCAECDVVSDSPNDACLVCGSRSLFNIARMFGGNLPKERASLIAKRSAEVPRGEVVFVFPKPHRVRRKPADTRQLSAPLDDNEADRQGHAMLMGLHGD